jgi:uncharacterized membrane protein
MDWMTTMHWCAPLLASTFVIAGALWIGTLFSVSWLSGCARLMADGPEIGRLALSLFRRWTTPSLCVSLLTGLGWLADATLGGVRAHWDYWGALVVVPLVALHAAAGRRAKRVAEGHVEATQDEAVMPMHLTRG